MLSERKILNETRLRCGRLPHATLWRNEVGTSRHENRVVRYGLCVGSADLIGIREVRITESHVGTIIGQFVALELKTQTGRLSNEQKQFLALVTRRGGLAAPVRTPEDALEILCR